jgi:hypothetical protein
LSRGRRRQKKSPRQSEQYPQYPLLAAIRLRARPSKWQFGIRKLDHEGALRQSQSTQAGAKLQQVLKALNGENSFAQHF